MRRRMDSRVAVFGVLLLLLLQWMTLSTVAPALIPDHVINPQPEAARYPNPQWSFTDVADTCPVPGCNRREHHEGGANAAADGFNSIPRHCRVHKRQHQSRAWRLYTQVILLFDIRASWITGTLAWAVAILFGPLIQLVLLSSVIRQNRPGSRGWHTV